MRRTIITLAVALAGTLAVPASAGAWTMHNFRVWDAGPVIRAKVTICDRTPVVARVRIRADYEMADGADSQYDVWGGWQDETCIRWVLDSDDTLEFRGTYFARLKIRSHGIVKWTGWRGFQSY